MNSLGMRFVPVPGTNVLFSVWETRVKDYQAFCDATEKSWENPGFTQTGDHPAVNVSWDDAKAFCEWLSEKEGKKYRLPTDHEWSCAVGIGDRENADATPKSKDTIADVFPWGEQWPPPNDAGNYFGEECKTATGLAELKAAGFDPLSSLPVIEGFNDGNVFTAAVGSFRPNGLGIYDLGGNVWEWCQDEYERAWPGECCAAVRGTMASAASWCRPTASPALPIIATFSLGCVRWSRLVRGAKCQCMVTLCLFARGSLCSSEECRKKFMNLASFWHGLAREFRLGARGAWWQESASRVLRGGSWNNNSRDVVLSSYRLCHVPTFRFG